MSSKWPNTCGRIASRSSVTKPQRASSTMPSTLKWLNQKSTSTCSSCFLLFTARSTLARVASRIGTKGPVSRIAGVLVVGGARRPEGHRRRPGRATRSRLRARVSSSALGSSCSSMYALTPSSLDARARPGVGAVADPVQHVVLVRLASCPRCRPRASSARASQQQQHDVQRIARIAAIDSPQPRGAMQPSARVGASPLPG